MHSVPMIKWDLLGRLIIPDTRETPPLTIATKTSYGVGQLAEGLKNASFSVFVFFFYTAVLGLNPTLAGIALFIALLCDAITDPLVGYLSDSWRSRWGRRHPFMLAAAIPLALTFYLLFSPPLALGQWGLFVWLTVFAVLARSAITLHYVPHVSLGAELSCDFHERTTVVAYRYFASYFGYMCAYGIGFGVFFAASEEFTNGQFDRAAYSPFAATLALMMVASILITAFGTYHRVPYLLQPTANMQIVGLRKVPLQLFREVMEALRNRSFAWLFMGVLVVYAMVGVEASLSLHMNTFFWELSSQDNLAFYVASPIGVLLGAGFVRRCNEWFDKKPCMIAGVCGFAAFQVVPVVLRLVGWFPENHTDALLWTLVSMKFLQGLFIAQALITFNSMIPDIIDEQELATGRRQEGIFFAATSFSQKATHGIGTFFAGITLWVIDWPEGAGEEGASQVSAQNIIELGLAFGPVLAGFAVLSVYCYSKHDLNRQRHAAIVAALDLRRSELATN